MSNNRSTTQGAGSALQNMIALRNVRSPGDLPARRGLAVLVQALIFLGLAATAFAQTITLPWYEPFSYSAIGERLGQTANSGNVAWGNGNKDSQRIAAGSLSYPAFALSSSNKVSVTVAGSGAINDFNEARPQFATVGSASSGGVLYLSFLMNIRDFANITNTSPGNAIMGFTASGGTSRYGSINLWSDGGNIKVGAVKYNGATTVSSSSFFASTVASNTTYLVVLKYEYVTNTTSDDVVTVWLNPASSSFGINGSEDAGNKISTSAGADGTSGLQRCYLLDGFNADVDEVRLGTSWQAVMPAECDGPLFFTQPQPATNVVGGANYFIAVVGGTDNVYQWRRAGTNLVNGGNIAGANSAALSINPVGVSDAANYDLVVTNACSGQSKTSSVVALTVISGANLVWSGDGTLNQWDKATANWNGNTATFADFDSVTFNDTSANSFVTLVGQQNPGIVTVNSTADYTLTGDSLGGIATLIKTNTGTLVLASNNTYTGRTTIRGGAISVDSENVLGANPPVFAADQLTLDGGTLRSGASVNINDSNRGISLGAGGGTFEAGFGAPITLTTLVSGSGQLKQNGPALLKLDKPNNPYTGGTLVNGGRLEANQLGSLGTGDVTIETGATLFMCFGENGHSNNIVAKDGSTLEYRSGGSSTYALVLRGALTSPPASSITITQNNASSEAKLRLYGAFTNTANISLVTAGGPIQLTPYNSSVGQQIFTGNISGVGEVYGRGSIVLSGQNTFNRGDATYGVRMAGNSCTIGIGADSTPTSGAVVSSPLGAGSLSIATHGSDSGTGTLLAWGGARTVANPIYYTYATNSVTLVLGGTNALTLSGAIELSRATDTQGTNRTLQVDNTALTTLSGVISDSGLGSGITKTGSGVLALNNANTYTGPTTVSAGILQVNGTLAAGSAVTVSSNGVLAGTGTIGGSVTVDAGGAIAPGTSIGNLTVSGNVTLSGDMIVEVNRTGSLSDKVTVGGTLANTGVGTVTVTNLGATLQSGDTFTLFSKPLVNGAAMTVTGGGVSWVNNLAVNGSIQVAPTVPTTGTNISFVRSGNTLTLSWPSAYVGWSLQTNAVGLTATNSWFPHPGSTTVSNIAITINPAQTNVYFRMSLP